MGILKVKLRSRSLPQLLLITPLLLIIHIIYYIINGQYNYNIYNKCHNEVNMGSKWGSCYFLFENKFVKPCVQSHVPAHSLPWRRPNKKYLVNISHLSRAV